MKTKGATSSLERLTVDDIGPETFAHKEKRSSERKRSKSPVGRRETHRNSIQSAVSAPPVSLQPKQTRRQSPPPPPAPTAVVTKPTTEPAPKVIYASPSRGINTGIRVLSHASLDKLVEKLTDTHNYESDFRDAFLLTYRSFCTPLEFVQLLVGRYGAALDVRESMSDSNASDTSTNISVSSDMFTEEEAAVVMVRIMSVMKHWIKESGYIEADVLECKDTQNLLLEFLEQVVNTVDMPTLTNHAEIMLKKIEKIKLKAKQGFKVQPYKSKHRTPSKSSRRKLKKLPGPPAMVRGVTTGSVQDGSNPSGSRPRSSSGDHTTPSSSSSRREGRTKSKLGSRSQPLSGISAQSTAQQLTLIESELYFCRLKNRELTNRAWTRETKRTDAPGVIAMIELFDARAEWVSSEILHPKLQTVERAKMISFFIDVADYCRRLHNYNTLFEIATGLNAPCIKQLHTTWGLVSSNYLEKYQCLMQICSVDENYKNYRQAFALGEGHPRLPCLFVLAKDLYGVEESMPAKERGLVHFRKFRKIHEVINAALECQTLRYLPRKSDSSHKKRKISLSVDENVQAILRHRLDTVRRNSSELFRLAKKANTQESILFVNSLSEAGFL